MNNQKPKATLRRKFLIGCGSLLAAALIAMASVYAAVNLWPNIGAQTVEIARRIVGDQAIADVENIVLQSEDKLRQLRYNAAGSQAGNPWQSLPSPSNQAQGKNSAAKPVQPASGAGVFTSWAPAPIVPLGDVQGEGLWTAYIQNPGGETVAARTFLQPDPGRAYAYAAVVAFDLRKTRLHFVLGYDEPKSKVQVPRSGRIPAADLQPGLLLAAFNGGFKAQHGHFGVMSGGVTLIPPRTGFGTVALYDDGSLRIGAWGTDINTSRHLIAWRQNGPLIVQDGQINPHTADRAPLDWGFTVYGDTATYRSALGISQDGNTLYYIAGPSLTLPALARAMQDAGAYQAVQLDINNFWVHFEAFQTAGNKLVAVPLLGDMNGVGNHRFLTAYSRDYFYLTAK